VGDNKETIPKIATKTRAEYAVVFGERQCGSLPSVQTMPFQPLLFLDTTSNQGSSLMLLPLLPGLGYYFVFLAKFLFHSS
jgi:hypothetical protein